MLALGMLYDEQCVKEFDAFNLHTKHMCCLLQSSHLKVSYTNHHGVEDQDLFWTLHLEFLSVPEIDSFEYSQRANVQIFVIFKNSKCLGKQSGE